MAPNVNSKSLNPGLILPRVYLDVGSQIPSTTFLDVVAHFSGVVFSVHSVLSVQDLRKHGPNFL